jgi:hypothetical protein
LNYYIKALFESKKDEIKKIKRIIENKWGKYKNYMSDYDEAEKNNLILSIIYCGLKNEIKNNEKEIRKYIEAFENSIREKKIGKIGKDDLHRLLIFFREIKNKESFIKVFNEEIYEYTINYATAYLILDDSTFIFYNNNNDNDESKYKFGNIGYNLLTNLENTKIYFTKIDKDFSTLKNNFIQLYNYLINIEKIIKNNEALSYVLSVKVEFKLENNNIYNSIRNAKITPFTRFSLSDDELNNIIEIITQDNNLLTSRNDNNKKRNEKIILQLSNNCCIVKKEGKYYARKSLFEYDLCIKNLSFIIERKGYNKNSESIFQLIIIADGNLSSIELDFTKIDGKKELQKIPYESGNFRDLFQLDKDNFILYEENDVSIIKNMFDFDKNNRKNEPIKSKDKNVNTIDREKLLAYYRKKLTNEFELYMSYKELEITKKEGNISKNYLILSKFNDNDIKVLVCFCKKNNNEQGILILFENREQKFENTADFEVVRFEDVGADQFNAYNSKDENRVFKVDFDKCEVKELK